MSSCALMVQYSIFVKERVAARCLLLGAYAKACATAKAMATRGQRQREGVQFECEFES